MENFIHDIPSIEFFLILIQSPSKEVIGLVLLAAGLIVIAFLAKQDEGFFV